jgi:hypothetical protein
MLNYILICITTLIVLSIYYIKINKPDNLSKPDNLRCSTEHFDDTEFPKQSDNMMSPVADIDIGNTNLSRDVPIEKQLDGCRSGDTTCEKRRISDKYNLSGLTGGQSLYVNIDPEMELGQKNLKWKNKSEKLGCQKGNDFSVFNDPEKYYHINKVQFSDIIEDNERVSKTFNLYCPKKDISGDNLYLSKYRKKRLNSKKNKIKRSWQNNDEQKQTDFNINNIDYKNAEQFYDDLYGYDIGPMNMTNWYLPSNYSNYSEYNDKTLDKKILKDKIPKQDRFRTRAFNWQFGEPI